MFKETSHWNAGSGEHRYTAENFWIRVNDFPLLHNGSLTQAVLRADFVGDLSESGARILWLGGSEILSA